MKFLKVMRHADVGDTKELDKINPYSNILNHELLNTYSKIYPWKIYYRHNIMVNNFIRS